MIRALLLALLLLAAPASAAELKVSTWNMEWLTLRRAGDPYERTPGQLLTETHVTSGTMTNRLDVLVERQLVSRRPDPQDRRVTRVQLTEAGRERVDSALTELLAVEAELLAQLNPADRRTLAVGLQHMLDSAASHTH